MNSIVFEPDGKARCNLYNTIMDTLKAVEIIPNQYAYILYLRGYNDSELNEQALTGEYVLNQMYLIRPPKPTYTYAVVDERRKTAHFLRMDCLGELHYFFSLSIDKITKERRRIKALLHNSPE